PASTSPTKVGNSRDHNWGVSVIVDTSKPLSQHALVQLVSRLSGCLPSLTPNQDETLVLRSGYGLSHSYSPSQVARILRVSTQRETQIEQAAVAGLQNASAHSGCASSSPGTVFVFGVLVPRAPLGIIQTSVAPSSS